jgi:hypothetical protein
MTPGRETAAGFFVARRVAAIRWKNDRRRILAKQSQQARATGAGFCEDG